MALGIMDLDIHVDRWLEARSEELNLLRLHEGARPGQQGLESVLVIFDSPWAFARGKLAQGIGSKGRPEAEIQELGEAALGWVTSSCWTCTNHI